MYEMLKKEDRKNTLFHYRKSVNSSYIKRKSRCNQALNINELRIKYKVISDENNSINKNRNVVQMKLYNTQKKSKPVTNLEDLNTYVTDIFCGQVSIEYSMFDAAQEMVDAAIQELDSSEFDSCYDSEDKIRQVIEDKIHELIARRETEEQTEKNEKKERLKILSDELKKMFKTHEVSEQKGSFIGDEKKWHIHIVNRNDIHLKNGNGARRNINSDNKESIEKAVNMLQAYVGTTREDVKQCYCWLRCKMIEWFNEDLPNDQQFYV